ncbi:MAG: nucleoside hydrolase [Desulfobacteraceae bacterium]|nr:nucleoside hydrolase [Desulfobacteraceae bacterium]
MKIKLLVSILFACLCYSPVLAGSETIQSDPGIKHQMPQQKQKVIIDTDMGWDDTLSILYLMKRPDIEIAGIAVTGCGETNLRWGKIIARTLMELGDKMDVPVSSGTETPLKYNHVFPQPFRSDMNDLMGLLGGLNPEKHMQFDSRPAWTLISDILNQTREPVTILCLGGFTNMAKMLRKHPETDLSMINGIYAMAGAIFVDGNVASLNNARPEWNQGPIYSSNYRAEWNIFVDPLAAKTVFDSSVPLTLIPLDACDYVMLSPKYINEISEKGPISSLVKKILQKKTGSHNEGIPVPIFDPLATMVMANGLQQYEYARMYLGVDLKQSRKKNTCGNIYYTENGTRKINVVQGVSNYLFSKDFARTINN